MGGIAGFNERLQKNAGDLFKVDFHDSGTLMKADEMISGLRSKTIQYMFHTTSYITRSLKVLGITGLPGIAEQLYEHGDRMKMESPLWKLLNDEMAKDNMFMLTAGGGVLEPEYIWSAKDKIASLKDLNGKRCRVVSYEATEVLKNFGVAGVRVPSSETYLALQRGTVDAAVANISTIIGRRLFEQIKYCYKLPVTGFTISLFFLKSEWDKLEDKYKAVFWEAAQWFDETYASYINEEYYKNSYWPEVTAGGMEVIPATKEDLAEFEKSSQPIWDWWAKEVGEDFGQKAIKMALGKS